MAEIGAILATAGFLALVLERLIELFLAPLFPFTFRGYEVSTRWLMLVAIIGGELLCFSFGIDLITPLAAAAGLTPVIPYVGTAVTGLVVAGGSNFLHDIFSSVRRSNGRGCC